MEETGAQSTGLRFAVLGPVRAWRGDEPLDLGGPQRQAVLAMLLLRKGRPVGAQELVDAVWGEDPAPSALGALRNQVLSLRRVLEPERRARDRPSVLRSVGDGYALTPEPGAVDWAVAEAGAAAAVLARRAGDLVLARAELAAALDSWSGEPLGSVPGPGAEIERIRLIQCRLGWQEDLLDLDLSLGRHGEAVPELMRLAAEHPLRERLQGLLMTALYGAGRQAEALEVYTRTRQVLVQELGVEPERELSALHHRLLSGELTAPQVTGAASRAVRPAQLPADIGDFTGRVDLIEQIIDVLVSDSMAACAVAGMGGVGKTTLAVHVAHRVRERFPDGQLYANLRGMDEHPALPGEVLGGFLRALGCQEGEIPRDTEQRAALYRSHLAGQRVVVLLDNAKDAAQIRQLMPGTPGCSALVTSRVLLSGLSGVRVLPLEVLDPTEALDLFTRVVGRERADAEREVCRAVVAACGFLPLAVRIVGARLASRGGWSVASVLARLSDERRRLDELRAGDAAVEATFRLGYGQLDAEQARVFRLLAVPDVPGLPVEVAAAVLECSRERADEVCESLVDLGLLQCTASGRYRYHDLMRLFALRQPGPDTDGGQEPDQVLARVLDFYLASAKNLVGLRNRGTMLPVHLSRTRSAGVVFTDAVAAQRWLDSERPTVTALYAQAATTPAAPLGLAADLAWALAETFDASTMALDVARRLGILAEVAASAGQPMAEARARVACGSVLLLELGERGRAREQLSDAVTLLESGGDPRLLAWAVHVLATVDQFQGDTDASVERFDVAITLYRRLGERWGEALALATLSKTYSDVDRLADAERAARGALEIAEATGDRAVEAFATQELGWIAWCQGDRQRAFEKATRALRLARGNGRRMQEGWSLIRLARLHLADGDPVRAESTAAEAVQALTETADHTHRGNALLLHGIVLQRLGRLDDARERYASATELYTRLELPAAARARELLDELTG
ncbi:tetratricopeptide repeat protein [Solihabitans fulvus]|uniref:Tetratricopeptide repeat protein n=1 Tax=Solihabitans fulvus TaxID=1892852 RepID=A0A5B2X8G6_9PSEU|nr:BTAD domain-containing putative transcriptional regulator [Solihabitans fulvus]KAA2259162.1 tetratricopeptide repeat protein [Solihabitans fulvus]